MFILKETVNQYTIAMLLFGRKGRGYTRCRESRNLDCMITVLKSYFNFSSYCEDFDKINGEI